MDINFAEAFYGAFYGGAHYAASVSVLMAILSIVGKENKSRSDAAKYYSIIMAVAASSLYIADLIVRLNQ